MGKNLVKWVIPIAALLVVAFLGGYLLGRGSSPYEISASTQRPMTAPVETELPLSQESSGEPAELPEAAQTSEITEMIDLNRATAEDLMTLPGIGEVLAERILEYRDVSGGFVNVEQLLEVSGIGEKTLEELSAFITVEGTE